MQRNRYASPRGGDAAEPKPVIEAVGDPGGEMTLHDIIALFRRHWILFIGTIVAAIGGTFAYVMVATPIYTAQGEIFVTPSAVQSGDQAAVRTRPAEIDDVPSEVALLRSRQLAADVIRAMALDEDPEFLDEEVAQGAPQARLDAVTEIFLKQLNVGASDQTRIIDVQFDSEDPVKAADIVNTLMDLYVTRQLADQRQTAEKAATRLANTVEELNVELDEAEEAVRAFRLENGLVQTQSSDLTANRVTELNNQVIQAEADEAGLRAELQQLERALARGGDASTAPRVLNSRLIQNLREQENELVRQQAELSTQYGEKHPRMIQVRTELRDVRENIQGETRKVVESLRSEVGAARARVSSLRDSMRDIERDAVQSRGVEGELQELVNEAASKREMLNSFRIRLRETQAQRDLVEANARVYARAETPSEPSFPQKGKALGIAGILGLGAAVVMVMVLGNLRRTLETADEVERVTGYRSLGVVPRLTGIAGGKKTAKSVLELYSKKPYAPFSQALKSVRSTLYVANGSRAPKTLLVTSAGPGEGKTTFAMSYGMLCASFGEKVILLDCDFGRPDLHKKMDVPNDLGIANYLMGEVDLETVIRNDGRSGMDYITSGALPPTAAELSRSSALKGIIDSLAWDYDVVIVDTAPILAMSDSQILSTMVDATVFVTRWRQTRMENAAAAVARLEDLGTKAVAGFVIVDVPVKMKQAAVYYSGYHR